MSVTFVLNGSPITSYAPDNMTLLDVLRDELHLTGTKKGCETGECGACTVLVDGDNMNACLLLIGEVAGRQVMTIEGLGTADGLDPVQRAFAETGAVQCGYCTPGMIMSVKALLNRSGDPSREEIRQALSGNFCRCTGYEQIFEAVEHVVKQRADRDE